MAIQMRRGLMRDFDPYKMLPGEWAVSIDASTSNQIVWMCFEPGVCKRMGTYEDFVAQIKEATEEVKTEYSEEFNAILNEVKTLSNQVSSNKNTVVSIKTDIQNTYLPQIQKALSDAQSKAESAKNSADTAAISEANAKTSEKNAKSSETAAKNSQTNAAASESNAKTSAANAATSASTATTKATAAANSASSAATSALTATNKAIEASQYAEEAAESAKQSQISADAAAVSETNAKTSETNAKTYAEQAKTISGEQVALNRQTLGYSKKNLLKNTATTKTANGITFTVNEYGSITANGTATRRVNYPVGSFVPTPNTTYAFSANSEVPVSNYWNNYCYIYNIDGDRTWRSDYDTDSWKFTPTTDTNIVCYIHIESGTTVENLTFYPMIRSAEITDGTYEPYVDDVDTRLKDVDAELGEIPNTYIPKKSILNSQEEIEANTSEENIAGALAVKELKNNIGLVRSGFGVYTFGGYSTGIEPFSVKKGIDTVIPITKTYWSGGGENFYKVDEETGKLIIQKEGLYLFNASLNVRDTEKNTIFRAALNRNNNIPAQNYLTKLSEKGVDETFVTPTVILPFGTGEKVWLSILNYSDNPTVVRAAELYITYLGD